MMPEKGKGNLEPIAESVSRLKDILTPSRLSIGLAMSGAVFGGEGLGLIGMVSGGLVGGVAGQAIDRYFMRKEQRSTPPLTIFEHRDINKSQR